MPLQLLVPVLSASVCWSFSVSVLVICGRRHQCGSQLSFQRRCGGRLASVVVVCPLWHQRGGHLSFTTSVQRSVTVLLEVLYLVIAVLNNVSVVVICPFWHQRGGQLSFTTSVQRSVTLPLQVLYLVIAVLYSVSVGDSFLKCHRVTEWRSVILYSVTVVSCPLQRQCIISDGQLFFIVTDGQFSFIASEYSQ